MRQDVSEIVADPSDIANCTFANLRSMKRTRCAAQRTKPLQINNCKNFDQFTGGGLNCCVRTTKALRRALSSLRSRLGSSSPSAITSPKGTPMRKQQLQHSRRKLRAATTRWMSPAQATASTTEANSTGKPSPMVLKMRPSWRPTEARLPRSGRILRPTSVALSSAIICVFPTMSATKIAPSCCRSTVRRATYVPRGFLQKP